MKQIVNYYTEIQAQANLAGYWRNPDFFAGNFAQKSTTNHSDYYLHKLNEYQQNMVKDIVLKENETIYCANTDRSRLSNLHFFVKINTEKCLVYFNAADTDTEDVVFATRGIKLRYLNLLK